jgi:electron transport complex protein RnfB
LSALVIMTAVCVGCGACLRTCPERAIRVGAAGRLVVLGGCTGCGECIEICPADACVEVRR